MQTTRSLVWGLEPKSFERLTIVAAIRKELNRVIRKTEINVSDDLRGMYRLHLPNSTKILVYRIMQEAIDNSVCHTLSTEMLIETQRRNGCLCVEISDNGCGFNPFAMEESMHCGLTLMKERTKMVGGTFSIESKPDSGTKVSFAVPIS